MNLLIKQLLILIVWEFSLLIGHRIKVNPSRSYLISGRKIDWPNQNVKDRYIESGRYISDNVVAVRGATIDFNVFVTLPRFRTGVPFTLGQFSLVNQTTKLEPFPSWQEQSLSMYNAIDICSDLNSTIWVLDSGVIHTLDDPARMGSAKIYQFDSISKTSTIIIDLSLLTCPSSQLQSIILDFKHFQKYLYVSDPGTQSLIIWNLTNNCGHRVMLPKKINTSHSMNNVMYMELIQLPAFKNSWLYFTYLDNDFIYRIETKKLINKNSGGNVIKVGKKPFSMIFLGSDGFTLFFRKKGGSEILMWNTTTDLKEANFVLIKSNFYNKQRIPTHVFIDNKGILWALDTDFPSYINGSVRNNHYGPTSNLYPLANFQFN